MTRERICYWCENPLKEGTPTTWLPTLVYSCGVCGTLYVENWRRR